MKKLLIAASLLALCAPVAQAAEPPTGGIGDAIQAERIVLQMKPGLVVKARSSEAFTQADTVGVAAFANGRKLWDANAGGHRFDLAGFGAYVVVNANSNAPLTFKAVALRKMRKPPRPTSCPSTTA